MSKTFSDILPMSVQYVFLRGTHARISLIWLVFSDRIVSIDVLYPNPKMEIQPRILTPAVPTPPVDLNTDDLSSDDIFSFQTQQRP